MISEGMRVRCVGGFNSGKTGEVLTGCKSMNDKIQVRFDGGLFPVWIWAYLFEPEAIE
jgi:hypothetical protein